MRRSKVGWRGRRETYSLAVTARAVQLAKVLNSEVRDADCANAVVLNDFVRGTLGTAARDGTSAVAFEGESVLADCLPPDVSDSAGTGAVHAFDLIGTDDDIREGASICDDEDSVGITTFSTGAGHAAAKSNQAAVEVRNLHGCRKSGFACCSGEGTGCTAAGAGRSGVGATAW